MYWVLICRELAAESIYKERCIAVDNGENWAKYMSISGSPDDEYNIITLQYTEEGLLTVDENREGHAAAFVFLSLDRSSKWIKTRKRRME